MSGGGNKFSLNPRAKMFTSNGQYYCYQSGMITKLFDHAAVHNIDDKILAPKAKVFKCPESVAEFLREQETDSEHMLCIPDHMQRDLERLEALTNDIAERMPDQMQKDLERLEALTTEINDYPSDDEAKSRATSSHLLPAFERPLQVVSNKPSTLTGSTEPTASAKSASFAQPASFTEPTSFAQSAASAKSPMPAFDQETGPVIGVTKGVWDALEEQKRELEEELAMLRTDIDHDTSMRIGKLRYQNESNKDQKASMARVIAEKDLEIKQKQLDMQELDEKIRDLEAKLKQSKRDEGELNRLRRVIEAADAAHAKDLEIVRACHKRELMREEQVMIDLQNDYNLLINERNEARATGGTPLEVSLKKELKEQRKMTTQLQNQFSKSQDKVFKYQDEIERLKEQLDKVNLDGLKAQLKEKTSQSDRFRNQVKHLEQRLSVATNGGEYLKGGAHLVAPNAKTVLPKTVMPCSECYAKNITCDGGAKCRPCAESNTTCARWRCSLKQKLGECHLTPCSLPHDPQGWLVMNARPEW
jgi:DNA repair exonuclease SbcCD ATPase subunit